MKVEVSYDGEAQLVDVASSDIHAGRATPLYDPPRLAAAPSPCKQIKPSGPYPRVDYQAFTCKVEVVGLVPYVDEIGWAEPGRSWALISVVSGLFGPLEWRAEDGPDRVVYDPETRESFALTVDGRPVASTVVDNPEEDAHAGNTLVAVDVPTKGRATLRLSASYASGPVRSTDGLGGFPDPARASFTRAVPLAY